MQPRKPAADQLPQDVAHTEAAGGVQELQWERDVQWGGLQEGASFPKPKPVFQRIEDPAPDAKTAVAA